MKNTIQINGKEVEQKAFLTEAPEGFEIIGTYMCQDESQIVEGLKKYKGKDVGYRYSPGCVQVLQAISEPVKLDYVDGRAVIKIGRKTVAKIFNRPVFFAGTRFENSFTEFPFCLEIITRTSGMSRECKTEAEAIHFLNKYL